MKRKNIVIYLSTFLLFALSAVYLIIAFHYQSVMKYFIICGIAFMLFCITNKLASKSITRPEGYNLIQAFFFYKKCLKNGIRKKPDKLNRMEKELIVRLALDYDFVAGFNEEQLLRVYADGYETARLSRSREKEE